jgi:hypothetical protein
VRSGLSKLETLFGRYVLPFRSKGDNRGLLSVDSEAWGLAREDFTITRGLIIILLTNARYRTPVLLGMRMMPMSMRVT